MSVGTGEAIRQLNQRLQGFNFSDGYMATANQPDIHMNKNELYLGGANLGTGISTARDFLIYNNGSNRVRINAFQISHGAEAGTQYFADVDNPGTGTLINPMNVSTHAQDSNIVVRYGNAIVNTGTGTMIPAGSYSGSSDPPNDVPGLTELNSVAFRLEPGESFAARWTPGSAQGVAFNSLLAEFDPTRDIEDNPLDLE